MGRRKDLSRDLYKIWANAIREVPQSCLWGPADPRNGPDAVAKKMSYPYQEFNPCDADRRLVTAGTDIRDTLKYWPVNPSRDRAGQHHPHVRPTRHCQSSTPVSWLPLLLLVFPTDNPFSREHSTSLQGVD